MGFIRAKEIPPGSGNWYDYADIIKAKAESENLSVNQWVKNKLLG